MKNKIKEIGLALARKNGLINLSRKTVCDRAGIGEGSFQNTTGITFTQFIDQLLQEIGPQPEFFKTDRGRVSANLRRIAILSATIYLGKNQRFDTLTRKQIAEKAGVSEASIQRYFPYMEDLHTAILEVAVRDKILGIIATGIALNHPVARNAPEELRKEALRTLA